MAKLRRRVDFPMELDKIKKYLKSKIQILKVIVGFTALILSIIIFPSVFQFFNLVSYYDKFIIGAINTINLYIFALVFGLILGLTLAIARVYGGRVISRVATGYIEIIRGTPVVTQIIIITFLPNVFTILVAFADPWSMRYLLSAICLGMNSAAYQAEFFRGSITSISGGQMMAARAIGMTRAQGIRRIIIPQSLRRVIPAWSNEASYLPKVTTAAYIVGVAEVFAWAKSTANATFRTMQVYSLVAVFFIIVIFFVTWFLDIIHDYTKIPGL